MTANNSANINKLTFEQALSELEEIVSSLEQGEAGLEDAMENYAKGQQLKDFCNSKLTKARLQVEQINSENAENISISAFDPDK